MRMHRPVLGFISVITHVLAIPLGCASAKPAATSEARCVEASPQVERAPSPPEAVPTGAVKVEADLGGGARAVLIRAPFDEASHTLTRCKYGVCAIDGAPFFGTATVDELPVQEVFSLEVVMGEARIPLEASGMFNPFSPLEDRELYMWRVDQGDDDAFTVRGEFSDGGGVYFGEWQIIGGRSFRTILTCNECLTITEEDFRRGPGEHGAMPR